MLKRTRKVRTSVRASRRMRTCDWVRPHASRRIAAQRCWGGGVLVRAATLLSTRGEDARRIWRNEADGEHACLIPAKPICGCRKRSPAPFHCLRIVIYNEWHNQNA